MYASLLCARMRREFGRSSRVCWHRCVEGRLFSRRDDHRMWLGTRERRRAGRMGWHRYIEGTLNLRDGRLMLRGREFTPDG